MRKIAIFPIMRTQPLLIIISHLIHCAIMICPIRFLYDEIEQQIFINKLSQQHTASPRQWWVQRLILVCVYSIPPLLHYTVKQGCRYRVDQKKKKKLI